MKNVLFALIVILLDVMAPPAGGGSCQHNDDPAEVSVSSSSINFTEDLGTRTIKVISNTKWTVVKDNQDWLTIVPMNGDGDKVISVTAALNTEGKSRYGEFLIKAGDASVKVTVGQSGRNP